MKKSLKKIWNIFTGLIVAVAVLLAILLVGVRLIGLRPYVVLSGSMEPNIHTGSMIYVKSIKDTRNIPAGTAITFMADEDTVVTHRVVAAVPDESDPNTVRYRTKGDANDIEDGTLVHYRNIIGTPVFSIPKLGYLSNYIQSPPGSYVAISAGTFLMFLMFLPELLSAINEKDGDEKAQPRKKKKSSSSRPVREEAAPIRRQEAPAQRRRPAEESEAPVYERRSAPRREAEAPTQRRSSRHTSTETKKRRGGAHAK